jgi:hypothetical protein
VASWEKSRPQLRSTQFLLRLAWDSSLDWCVLAQLAESPCRTRTHGDVAGTAGDRLPMQMLYTSGALAVIDENYADTPIVCFAETLYRSCPHTAVRSTKIDTGTFVRCLSQPRK